MAVRAPGVWPGLALFGPLWPEMTPGNWRALRTAETGANVTSDGWQVTGKEKAESGFAATNERGGGENRKRGNAEN